MKKYLSPLTLVLFTLLFVQCAKKGTPTGGEKDVLPPKYVRATPENYSVNFKDDEIRIYFNEYIKLNKAQEQIIFSPPMDPKPEITPLGNASKYIKIKLNDTLKENTTYAFNFGTSVVDNNENNPLPYFSYVFSTGSYIDSLSVTGTVSDALLKQAEPFISVMLYEINDTYSDSLVYTTPPRYITNTLDSLKTFSLNNLKAGTYQLVALKDLNNNYKFDPAKEKIAFLETPITIPTDSSFNLTLFKEELAFKPERPKQLAKQKILIGYRGKLSLDSLTLNPVTNTPSNFEYRFTKVADKDSLHLWIKPAIEQDSLKFELISSKKRDTLLTRLSEMPKDSLIITTEPSGNIEFNNDFIIKGNTPLTGKNDSLIRIINKDSLPIDFTSQIRPLDNSIRIKFEKKESESYQISLFPGAVTDFYEATNDTIVKVLRTKAFADYGNITLNLQNVREFPVIVQLTDEKGAVKSELYSTSESRLRFSNINPGKYLIRVIYDSNSNKKWDTGNYLKRIKPEEIIYFPEIMEVRANWDINQTFILK
ncbi:Ig-like domain-containing protein [Gillisia sp. M10.2A]|uniref:Ig-like domain-containing protein n=1 Tax=Gillisia lutea TaxID=2909668 RepID=A0ABS9EC90_9FLAO|nr:Ig-like domain-containing protein [Gillisia lutea]MCF4100490.1 Ig-like domain-containing protein [Gillisia lutea]